MRFISLFIFFITVTAGAAAQSKNLNGTWMPVKEQIGDTELPLAAFEKQRLSISDSTYTFVAESTDKGIMQYSGTDKMDIYGTEGVNNGKHFTAIYKFENDALTICYNLVGDVYPEAFDTKGKPLYLLCVFKKE
jgi:uncharacterized protein (TIGR03067 family)